MTVSTQVSRNEYTGNGATTQYDFTFRILDKSHLLVQTLDTSESIVTLTLGTDYTVTGVNRYNGGKVVLTSALPAGYKISIERSTPVTQEASIRNQGGFFPEIHEDAFDKLTMIIQRMYGWWSGLALKKPSWLANYYDALNNRIRNLRDPSQAQDAATKGYTDSADNGLQQQITSNFNHSLRVPDSNINQLPSAQDRAWKGLGFDGTGQPKLQDPAGTGLWGYVPAIGSFEQGSLLTQRFEVLLWESTDEYWRWDGVMPKVVLPGSTPATAGGTGKGKWIDVTDATLRSNLGSSEPQLGAYIVRRKNGGRVQNAIAAFYVDDYEGADPTGATDSTNAVIAAVKAATGLLNSCFVQGHGVYAEVVFGNGVYMLGNVPFYSCVKFSGQGKQATRIKPKPGASFCFDTIGTQDYYTGGIAKRLMFSGIRDMTVSPKEYQEPGISREPGVGGIRVRYASYFTLDDVFINQLDGQGVSLQQCWDSDFTNLQIMECGNLNDDQQAGLYIGRGTTIGSDGSNALRFRGLHIENCPRLLTVDRSSRHIFFDSPKLECVEYANSSIIRGVNDVTFNSPELTWSFAAVAMFSMVEVSGSEAATANKGVVFNSPKLYSPSTSYGKYFEYASSKGKLVVNSPVCNYVKNLITGRNLQINGGTAQNCGPDFIRLVGDADVTGMTMTDMDSASGSHIYAVGLGCRILYNKIDCSGTTTDAEAAIEIGAGATDARTVGNMFTGSRQYGVKLGNTTAKNWTFDNAVVDGGSYGAVLSSGPNRYTVSSPNSAGLGAGSVNSATIAVAAGSTGTVSVLGGASKLFVRAMIDSTRVAACSVFSDAAISALSLTDNINSGGGVAFSSDASGASPGDGKVYVSKTGANVNFVNYTSSAVVIYVTLMSSY